VELRSASAPAARAPRATAPARTPSLREPSARSRPSRTLPSSPRGLPQLAVQPSPRCRATSSSSRRASARRTVPASASAGARSRLRQGGGRGVDPAEPRAECGGSVSSPSSAAKNSISSRSYPAPDAQSPALLGRLRLLRARPARLARATGNIRSLFLGARHFAARRGALLTVAVRGRLLLHRMSALAYCRT
jgi:hypothetical protein